MWLILGTDKPSVNINAKAGRPVSLLWLSSASVAESFAGRFESVNLPFSCWGCPCDARGTITGRVNEEMRVDVIDALGCWVDDSDRVRSFCRFVAVSLVSESGQQSDSYIVAGQVVAVVVAVSSPDQ